MCAESLINYLVGKTGVPYEDIKSFIIDGEFMKDEDYNKRDKKRKLPQTVYENLRVIDKALENIKVADPAVGSGAFPLGMLSEIVKARNNITYYFASEFEKSEDKARIFEPRDLYRLKWDTIQNCIFAVDIEASAVDIAKLRLWLSLVVDENLDPTFDEQRLGIAKERDPRPLPNLDYNIMCGNSLIDEFDGIKLFDDSILSNEQTGKPGTGRQMQMSLFMDSMQMFLDDLRREQERLFGEQNPETKHESKRHIDKIIDDIIRAKLTKDNNAEGLKKYEESLKQKTKPYFLWKLEFAKVFRENGGFDVVIGNPPYVDSENMVKNMPQFREFCTQKYRSAKGNWDLFVLFIEIGYLFTAPTGCVSFIVPNKLVAAEYAKEIRTIMAENSVNEIRDYSNVRVFKEAAVYPVTFVSNKSKIAESVSMITMAAIEEIGWKNIVPNSVFYRTNNWDSHFSQDTQASDIIQKMLNHKILDCVSEVKGAATVSEAYEIKNILNDINEYDSSYFKFINTGTIDRYVSLWDSAKTQYIKQGYYRPVLKKQDLKGLYPKRYADATSEKIIIGGMTKNLECYYDNGEYLAGKSTVLVMNSSVDLKYLIGILNSRLMTMFYRTYFNSLSLAGGFLRIGAPQIKQLPIAIGNDTQIKAIVDLVSKVIDEKQTNPDADTSKLEEEIDSAIYEIYGLTQEEIKTIEGE